MSIIEQYKATQELTLGLMQGVSADQLDAQTPCSEWDVRALCNHVVGGAHMFTGALSGAEMPTPGEAPDMVGDDPAAAYQAASDALIAAYSADGALEQTVQMPFGEVPGQVVMSLAMADHLTHAWDLARATGQPYEAPDDLVGAAHGVWQQFISPEFRASGAFADEQPVDESASPADRLAGFTGRTP